MAKRVELSIAAKFIALFILYAVFIAMFIAAVFITAVFIANFIAEVKKNVIIES